MKPEDPDYLRTNREKSLMGQKEGLFWCFSCDLSLVGVGEKCPNCGKRTAKRKLKNY